MQIGDEVIWSAVSAIVVGLTLKSSEFFMSRRANEDDETNERISKFHDSMESQNAALREEIHTLKEESDKYRKLYNELLDRHIT